MVTWLVLAWLLVPITAADYTCSKNMMVLEVFTFDFLRMFQKMGLEIKKRTFDEPSRTLNFTMTSKDTHRNVTLWAVCNPNATKKSMCSGCIGILLNGIYEVCCEQRSSWGIMNMRTECSIGYSASEYMYQGWTDLGDLPKEVLKEPGQIDFDGAHSIPPTHILCFFSLLMLLFFGMF